MLCNHLDRIALRHERIAVMGDFNLPVMKWSVSNYGYTDSSVEYLMRQFIVEHNFIQIAYEPTKSDNLLDLIFVSSCFPSYEIETISLIGSSDHATQILKIPVLCTSSYRDFRLVIHFKRVAEIICQVNWQNKFNDCTGADDSASKFTNVLKNLVNDCTSLIPIFRRRRLPKHIVQLIRNKKKAWRLAKRTQDFIKFKSLNRSARAATRQQRQSEESRLIVRRDKRAFYSYVRRNKSTHEKIMKKTVLSDSAAANLFLREFFLNFTAPACQKVRAAITSSLFEL